MKLGTRIFMFAAALAFVAAPMALADGHAAEIDQTAEVGCAKCAYSVEGVSSCAPGVKIGDASYAVEGEGAFDVHGEGLCQSTTVAHVVGNVVDGKFMAKSIAVGEEAPAAEGSDETADTHEIGCGSCMYSMEGVKGCKTAVKIGDQAYLVTGLDDFNAHGEGLCKGTKTAKLTGAVEGDTFHATAIEVVE